MRDLQAVVIAIITTVIGVTVAVLAARHYYTRSVKHRLAIYWLPSPSVFYGADPDIMRDLAIQFRSQPVRELAVTEFLIANEGADPIRNVLEPLTFAITERSSTEHAPIRGRPVRSTIADASSQSGHVPNKIVDASVTYVQPEGRAISVKKTSDQEFRCNFALLNPDEYFYVKLITDGELRRTDIKCQIVAENLPPTLKVENTSKVSIGSNNDAEPGMLIPAAICLTLAAAIFLPLVALFRVHPSYFPFTGKKFDFVWWIFVPTVLDAIIIFLGLALTVGFITVAFPTRIRPRRRFNRPRGHYYPYAHYARIHSPYVDPDNALVRYPRDLP